MRYGVTGSGPMDRMAFQLAHFALGNDEHSAAVEISLGGLVLECVEGSVTACVAGGNFSIQLDNVTLPPWSTFTLHPGSVLKVRPGSWGSWCVLAFKGTIRTPTWLGSQSVHLNSGLCGHQFTQGDTFLVDEAEAVPVLDGELMESNGLEHDDTIRVVMGPQDRFFTDDSQSDLQSKPFKLTPEYNRMGVRLDGPKLEINSALDMPSAPISRGSLQVPGHGDPICLLADHQTTGGYPKIATVISSDIDKLVQKRVGESIRFQPCEPMEAVKAARESAALVEKLKAKIIETRQGLEYKLWNSNLISGAVKD